MMNSAVGKAIECLKLGELLCGSLENNNVESSANDRILACKVSEGSFRDPLMTLSGSFGIELRICGSG